MMTVVAFSELVIFGQTSPMLCLMEGYTTPLKTCLRVPYDIPTISFGTVPEIFGLFLSRFSFLCPMFFSFYVPPLDDTIII